MNRRCGRSAHIDTNPAGNEALTLNAGDSALPNAGTCMMLVWGHAAPTPRSQARSCSKRCHHNTKHRTSGQEAKGWEERTQGLLLHCWDMHTFTSPGAVLVDGRQDGLHQVAGGLGGGTGSGTGHH
jgi:hypothetical protein